MSPSYLSSGDQIGILSTARFITPSELRPALEFFDALGLKTTLSPTIFERNNQFAGTDDQRTSAMQILLDDPNIKAIFCARGGYGTVRIIDALNFDKFLQHPKWIVGYSDVTVLHNHLNQAYNFPTLHASMPISFPTNTPDCLKALSATLFGKLLTHSLPAKVKRTGKALGKIVGGNLSIITSLLGSNSQINTQGKILFIEDIDEMLYHLDRMMMALKRAGMLSELKGLIVGGMTAMRDNTKEYGFSKDNPYGQTAEQIIWQHVEQYKYPVCFDYPSGHQASNYPLILGMPVEIDFSDQVTITLKPQKIYK